ncbi:hypothetical protein FDP41_000995 [Naegleria fowleri]|uniref:DNA-directed RNA polymerase n=2 Tax=Naegleria TaxID=5761 RepID=A0A6A5BZ23_NAEFO|nr:uncharacterized protein FDP41_000995 [Naegleria fowleri]KAF0979842.1 hypothetical protein FDP41_000995 [Naegleria fowleri]CAG4716174.1 unnamed protein product [Naegleria fowleri]
MQKLAIAKLLSKTSTASAKEVAVGHRLSRMMGSLHGNNNIQGLVMGSNNMVSSHHQRRMISTSNTTHHERNNMMMKLAEGAEESEQEQRNVLIFDDGNFRKPAWEKNMNISDLTADQDRIEHELAVSSGLYGDMAAQLERDNRNNIQKKFEQFIMNMSPRDEDVKLLLQQKELETRSMDIAKERYRKDLRSANKRNQGSSLPPAKKIMLEWYEPLTKLIKEKQDEVNFSSFSKKKPAPAKDEESSAQNQHNFAIPLCLTSVSAEKLAIISLHEVLSSCLRERSGPAVSSLACQIGEAIQAEINVDKLKRTNYFKLITKNQLIYHNINRLSKLKLNEYVALTKEQLIQLGTFLIQLVVNVAKVPLVDSPSETVPAFIHRNLSKQGRLIGIVEADENLIQLIGREHVTQEILHPNHLPMLIPPNPWINSTTGGYIALKSLIMRTRGSHLQAYILKIADMTELLAGLNTLNETRWKINHKVYETVLKVWNSGGGLGELPSRFDDALPEEPETDDPEIKKKWKRTVAKIKTHNRNLHSLRCDMLLKLKVAEDFKENSFYFPHNVDFRGRAYPIPPHLNHLGADINRGLLTFDKGMRIGRRGIFWLKIHLANLYGKDKLSFDERVQFIEQNLNEIIDSADQPLDGNRWWLQSENPWQTLAACVELAECLRSENPEEFISHLPIQMDGSCNGLQHYAALGRDNLGALHVNLLPTSKPMDVYVGVLEVVKKHIERDMKAGNKLAKLLHGNVYRSTIKQTVMTSVYGVTFVGAREQIQKRLKEKKEVPEDDVFACASYLASITLKSLGEVFSSAQNIMEWLNDCALLISSSDNPVTWTTPLGLPVIQPYRSKRTKVVKTVMQCVTISDSSDKLPVSRTRQKSAFPPNFVHSLDSSHMFMTASACKKEGIEFASVHDSFWCNAGNVDRMNRIIREQFINLHSQPLLEELLATFTRLYPNIQFPPLPKKGSLDLSRVLDAPYFFD